MTDPLDNIQKRLGWINRGLIVGAAVIVVALIVFAVHRMRAGSAPAPAASSASAALHPTPAASVPRLAASAAAKLASAPAAAGSSAPAHAASGASQAGGQMAQAAASGPATPAQPGAVAAPSASSAGSAAGASAAAVPSAPAALPAPQAPAARKPAHHAARHERARAHAASSAVCSRSGWYVQVGAFAEMKSYEQLRARLERFHLPNCRGAHSPHGLHVLLVGPYATRAEAQRLRSHLKEPLRKASYLRHLGSK